MTDSEVMRILAEATGAQMQMADVNTYVSSPMVNGGAGVSINAGAPGASGPAAQMGAASAILWLVAGFGVVSVGTAYLARKGVRPEIGRFDALDAVWNASSVAVLFATFKLLAYRYHGHRISQAVLLLL